MPGANQPFWDDCAIPGNSNVRIEGAGYCNDLTVAAGSSLTVAPGPTVGSLNLHGASINNSGTIADGSSNGIAVSGMTFLSGGGTINLTTLPGQLQTTVGGTGTLVNVDNTIQGQGTIGLGALNLINQKTIVASGGTLSTYGSNITNTGVLQAAGASTLQLTSGGSLVINNTFGTISALDTGTVVLFSGTIVNGGILTTSGGSGVIQTSAGNVTLNSVTNAGAYTSYANTTLQGTMTNNGVIYAPNGGLWISRTTTLKGTGILSGNSGQLIGSIPGISGGVLVNQSTITGGGSIGDSGLTINNQGTINATNTSNHLVIAGSPATNTGLMEATGGGTVEIGTTVNNNRGTIAAQNGSFVFLAQYGSLGQGLVNGGTLVADGTITGALNSAGVHQLALLPGMTLLGQGTVVGDVSSSGTVFAGDSVTEPGLLTIQGNYNQYANGGVLSVAIDVCSPLLPCHLPLGVSQLAISKGATLGGTVKVSIGNVAPQIGEKFTILTAGAVSGQFANKNYLPINAYEHFMISYGPTAVTLYVVKGQ